MNRRGPACCTLLGEVLKLGHDVVEFVNERTRSRLAKNINQSAVIPERAVLAAAEAVENGVAFHAIVRKNFAGIGQFVCSGNEADVFGLMRDFFNVSALPLAPIRFFTGDFVGIRAAIDDARDAITKFFADFIEARKATLVLDGVVQQRSDDFVFTAAMLNDNGGNAEQMTYVGLALTLAALVQMQLRGITKRFHKTVREERFFDDGLPATQFIRPF